jgi:hypothetical protein
LENKVVEFKRKEKTNGVDVDKVRNEIKDNFLEAIGRTEEEVMNANALSMELLRAMEEQKEVVFKTENDALIFASAILDFPEFEHISHFEIAPNISRKSTFFSVKPVFKSEKQYVFADDEFLYSANLININRIKE